MPLTDDLPRPGPSSRTGSGLRMVPLEPKEEDHRTPYLSSQAKIDRGKISKTERNSRKMKHLVSAGFLLVRPSLRPAWASGNPLPQVIISVRANVFAPDFRTPTPSRGRWIRKIRGTRDSMPLGSHRHFGQRPQNGRPRTSGDLSVDQECSIVSRRRKLQDCRFLIPNCGMLASAVEELRDG